MCIYIYIYRCIYVCVCVDTHTHTHIYTTVYMYAVICRRSSLCEHDWYLEKATSSKSTDNIDQYVSLKQWEKFCFRPFFIHFIILVHWLWSHIISLQITPLSFAT